ncbi:hypothetical protein G9C98_000146 [Cotesia typhae]|uniref:Uncharacterized protein n=1 Tax=Cotesia typhae TaxID=2053667 RepID=A0A8J5QTN9_9HYME|nr:hypothetical protein G9C98_000146 [Cotesia typhae]
MPVKVDVVPPPPANSKQPGVTKSLLYNGSRFQGSQKSKGNSYDVEVVLQEHFLVPDHTIKDINGASFAGFYYICFEKSAASIEGYYYHRSSEWYQSLNLRHVPEHSIQIYEFR